MCEILAPAGDRDSAMAAINAGADAIYLGLTSYSARSAAANFGLEEFADISCYARALGVKVYVAMNTLVKDAELGDFLKTLAEVWNAGADAVILSDIFLGRYIKRLYPFIKLHLSTQSGVCNEYGAALAKKYGFDRVILSRETDFEDIKAIAAVIDTEVFVQGALCTCFSGQCYMSSFAGGNSGNRGRCKQPCRKLYSINREGFGEPAYRLSLSDLCIGVNINKYISAGVKSFKIEGRMRRPEYVAAAVTYYKKLLGSVNSPEDFSNLKRTFNRGNYTAGLAFGQDKSLISSAVQGHIGEFAGVIKVTGGKYLCLSDKKFCKGDGFKILRGGREVGGADFCDNASGGFILKSNVPLKNGDKAFITTDVELSKRLLSCKRRLKCKVSVKLLRGSEAEIVINGFKYCGNEILQAAVDRPLGVEDIKKCFKKVDKYPFDVEFGEIVTDGVFMPASGLNALRRGAFDGYFCLVSENKNPAAEVPHGLPCPEKGENLKTAVISQNLETRFADVDIYKPEDYFSSAAQGGDFAGDKFLYLPPFMTGGEIRELLPAISAFKGIYCDGVWAVELAERIGKPLFAGCGMNIANRVSVCGCPAEYIALSKELSEKELIPLCTSKTFVLSSGVVKVMDLVYCPFGKKCSSCDKRGFYVLTDENGRNFPLRRYKTENCRFEVYNCAYLAGVSRTGTLIDATGISDVEGAVGAAHNFEKQREFYKNYTRGHANSPVL